MTAPGMSTAPQHQGHAAGPALVRHSPLAEQLKPAAPPAPAVTNLPQLQAHRPQTDIVRKALREGEGRAKHNGRRQCAPRSGRKEAFCCPGTRETVEIPSAKDRTFWEEQKESVPIL